MKNSENRFDSIIIYDNRIMIYTVILYLGGLLIGCALYKVFGAGPFDYIYKKIIFNSSDNYINIFFNRTSVYLSVYIITVLFGMCIIGYPVICAVPLITGITIALKIAFYYTNYKIKGIGYSLLLIIPEAALFETLLIYTLNKSAQLSKTIFKGATNYKDMTKELELKSYLKSYLLYFFLLISIAALNSAFLYFVSKVVTL